MKIDAMHIILALGFLAMIVSFWNAHKNKSTQFNALDLIMEDGSVHTEKTVFMVVFSVMTWAFINKEMNNTLTEGFFTAYGALWATPLIASRIFKQKEMPGITSTTMTSKTVEVTKDSQ